MEPVLPGTCLDSGKDDYVFSLECETARRQLSLLRHKKVQAGLFMVSREQEESEEQQPGLTVLFFF